MDATVLSGERAPGGEAVGVGTSNAALPQLQRSAGRLASSLTRAGGKPSPLRLSQADCSSAERRLEGQCKAYIPNLLGGRTDSANSRTQEASQSHTCTASGSGTSQPALEHGLHGSPT